MATDDAQPLMGPAQPSYGGSASEPIKLKPATQQPLAETRSAAANYVRTHTLALLVALAALSLLESDCACL